MPFQLIEAPTKRTPTNNTLKGRVRVARHSSRAVFIRIAPDVMSAAGFAPDAAVSIYAGTGRDAGTIRIERPLGTDTDFRMKSGLDQKSSSVVVAGVALPPRFSSTTHTVVHSVEPGRIEVDLHNRVDQPAADHQSTHHIAQAA